MAILKILNVLILKKPKYRNITKYNEIIEISYKIISHAIFKCIFQNMIKAQLMIVDVD